MTHDGSSSDALFALLDRERATLIAQFERVPLAHRTDRPEEGAWSAVEIAEHVARVEAGVAKMLVSRATMPLTATSDEVAESHLTPQKIAWVRVRDVKVSAPDRTHPTGTLTPGMVMGQLAGARAGLRAAFIAADDAVLDGAIIPHPFVGPLTLRAWVELVAHHDARHAAQMAEVADHWVGTR